MELDMNNIPKHIAIILDGNGRWAKERHRPRVYGHRHGAFNLRDLTKYANSIGIKYMTVFCFSTENWKRPDDEVNYLMNMPVRYFKKFFDTLVTNTNIRYKILGRKDRIPAPLLKVLNDIEEKSKDKTGLTLSLCIDYGSYDEITTAVKKIATDVKENKIAVEDITPAMIENNLFTKDYPKLDLLIRTSGEYRISNFLLWQLGYAELYFTKTYFPDFNSEKLKEALIDYQSRNRRYGGLNK